MRALIIRKLSEDDAIEVVGTAPDAAEARRLIKSLNPDVVTLDVEMPGMDGLSFLEKIMELRPTPVIIVSGSTGPGARATARAMQLGAISCYAKSTGERSIADDDGGLLIQLVHEAAQAQLPSARKTGLQGLAGAASVHDTAKASRVQKTLSAPDVIVIGSSTGGVEALHSLLSGFPENCPPTLVVQHINSNFAGAIVRSLDSDVAPRVSLANPDRALSPGEVVVAAGDTHHLVLGARSNPFSRFRCAMRESGPISGHRPSVDALFHSAANNVGEGALGILLTGMGRDGAEGLLALSQAGAQTIAQDKDTCVVFGMPVRPSSLAQRKACFLYTK
ncbi:MAG: chemotaxis-specific protein-glutamate methyltransferase CheB [Pseudomonadota bacterium]